MHIAYAYLRKKKHMPSHTATRGMSVLDASTKYTISTLMITLSTGRAQTESLFTCSSALFVLTRHQPDYLQTAGQQVLTTQQGSAQEGKLNTLFSRLSGLDILKISPQETQTKSAESFFSPFLL